MSSDRPSGAPAEETGTPDTEDQWRAIMAAGGRAAQGGDMAGALQAFDAAVKLCPERIEGWINLGSMMVECRQLQAAVNVLIEALKLQPDNMVAYMIMGDAQRLRGERTIARQCYERAVELERTPDALNRLACMIRHLGEHDAAMALYDEALDKDPQLSIARVNRATLHVAMGHYEEAAEQLQALRGQKLPPMEAREVASCTTAIGEFRRLRDLIDPLTPSSDLGPLESALRDLPQEARPVDRRALQTIATYMQRAGDLSVTRRELDTPLPDDWPLIEAMHMIPYVHSVDDYLAYLHNPPAADADYDIELHQSQNMEAAVIACRASRGDLADPVRLEAHLRHWHRLCCDRVPGFQPGHFKYNRNVDYRNPDMALVDPGAASSTFRIAAEKAYLHAPPGVIRAAIAFLIVGDLHPFNDGNGRVGMAWLNRELEWAGEMPAVFALHLGAKGEFGKALYTVRTNGGDLTPILEAIGKAQDYAKRFCAELAEKRRT